MHFPNFWQWMIILLIFVLLFGAKRLPELGESIGKAIRSFKKAHDEPDNLTQQQEAANPPGGTETAAPTCPACKKALGGDFAFCPHCGQRVKAA